MLRFLLLLTAGSLAEAQPPVTLGYGARKSAQLDLYRPAGAGSFRAVVAVHGGGWSEGSRLDAAPFCRMITELGYACAAPEYRLAPGSHFPAQLDDIEEAVSYLIKNAGNLHLNLTSVILAGESAGGHLVACVGADHSGGIPLAGVISFSAPMDLELMAEPGRALGIVPPEFHDLFGIGGWTEAEVAAMREASPIRRMREGAPPFLLIHGSADRLVGPQQASRFCEFAAQKAIPCEVHLIFGARHGLWKEDQVEKYGAEWKPIIRLWMEKRFADFPHILR